jgi:hypothetical protein
LRDASQGNEPLIRPTQRDREVENCRLRFPAR